MKGKRRESHNPKCKQACSGKTRPPRNPNAHKATHQPRNSCQSACCVGWSSQPFRGDRLRAMAQCLSASKTLWCLTQRAINAGKNLKEPEKWQNGWMHCLAEEEFWCGYSLAQIDVCISKKQEARQFKQLLPAKPAVHFSHLYIYI